MYITYQEATTCYEQNGNIHVSVILVCLQSHLLATLLSEADDVGMTSDEFVFVYCRFGMSSAALVNQTWSIGMYDSVFFAKSFLF